MTEPLVSIIVRSYNRLPSLCRLIDVLLAQTWKNLEVVVVEQSTFVPADAAVRLAAQAQDPRLRVLYRPPLGGAAARNVAVEQARGDVFLFIDDDDLPTDEGWVEKHMLALEDPRCLGASGKHVHNDEPVHRFSPLFEAFTRTLSYDPILKISMTYVQHDRRRIPVTAIHGTNASLRRAAWERFGGWDEDTAIEDEVSFCYRALRLKAPDEYFAYDPRPVILRNRDVRGGLDKRHMSIGTFFGHYLDFIHRIIGRYHPLRVVAFYPFYLLLTYFMAVGTIARHSRRYRGFLSNAAAALQLLIELPFHLAGAWGRLVEQKSRPAMAKSPQLQAVSEGPTESR
ncbi:MAG TPA: glycosyltransferase family 2 protein [Polyangia bacterium]|nr:glycosyltransferase family 2 protein [Polyangia bacterium]